MSDSSDRPLVGVAWMLLTGIFFVAVTAVVKYLDGGLPAAEAAFLRYVLGLVFLVPMIRPMLRSRMTRRDLALFGWRGAAHSIGFILWFYAMTKIPMAEVTALNYLSPVYITIGAALFLGETLALRRLLAVLAAVVGAFLIVRPGFREISMGQIAMLGTAMLFGASYLIAKHMSGRVSPATVVGMLSITVTIGLAPFAAAVWVTPTWPQIGLVFLVACFATAGHFTMTLAFRAAPVTVTQPVTFLQLVWSVLLGAAFFGEAIDGWVVMGGTLILAAVTFISWREAVLKRRAISAAATTPFV